MVEFKQLSQVDNVDNNLIEQLSFIAYKDVDIKIHFKNMIIRKQFFNIVYNEVDNVYDFPEHIFINKDFINNVSLLSFYIGHGEANSKTGVSLRLSDGEIIPIVHMAKYNYSLISKRGLNLGTNKFIYDKNLNKLIFINPDTPVGSLLFFDSPRAPNGYIIINGFNYNINDYPILKILGFVSIDDVANCYLRNTQYREIVIGTIYPDGLPRLLLNNSDFFNIYTRKDGKRGGGDLSTIRISNNDATSVLNIDKSVRFSEETRSKSACYNLIMRI